VRSRCARVRLGTVGARDLERLLASRGLADPPTAARLGRLAAGRPGVAVAYATAPEAEAIRGELTRTLLDLLGEGTAARLAARTGLMGRAATLAGLLAPTADGGVDPQRRRGRGQRAGMAAPIAGALGERGETTEPGTAGGDADEGAAETVTKASAAERRRALATLLDAWRDLARDLALAQAGATSGARDIALLEELEAAATRLPAGAGAEALARLARADELLEANVSPELLLDVLLLRWPHLVRSAA
jgi:hypothetical protein